MTTHTRRATLAAAGTIVTGSVATRLARLEGAFHPAKQDGDPIVVVFEDFDGNRDVRGTIGPDSLVIVFGYREDGPQ